VHKFPESASTILLPAHAAADPLLLTQIRKAHDRRARLILTTSLLSVSPQASEFARMLGLGQEEVKSQPFSARLMSLSPTTAQREATDVTVDLESPLEIDAGPSDILCTVGDKRQALLVTSKKPASRIALLNTHTFSQADFDAAGEVLLCPRPLGLLAMKGQPLQALRAAFRDQDAAVFEGPSCVTLHPLRGSGAENYLIQNYNERPVQVTLTVQIRAGQSARFRDVFTSQVVSNRDSASETSTKLDVAIPARGRVWIQPEKRE
jgi:hypothetical protein